MQLAPPHSCTALADTHASGLTVDRSKRCNKIQEFNHAHLKTDFPCHSRIHACKQPEMPVPLAATHARAAGLAAHISAELPSSGSLFAGLGSVASGSAAQQPAAAAGGADQAPAGGAQVQQAAAGSAAAGGSSGVAGDVAVATNALSFSYTDIGELRWL